MGLMMSAPSARSAPRSLALGLTIVAALSAIGVPASSGFVGGRLLSQGLFAAHPVWTFVAAVATAPIAARLLFVGWRAVSRGPAHEAAGAYAWDRLIVTVPLLMLTAWIGLAPAPFLDRLKIAAHHVASHVTPSDGTAAECDTVPTPEQLSSSPGSQFLLAVPCGPDGQPLSPPSTPP